jgi:hypothetical protein
MPRGGAREGSGRKPKADEQRLIEALDSTLDKEKVLHSLADLVQKGNFSAIKLWLEYRYGKPKDHIYERAEEEHIELPPWLRRLEIEYVDNTTDPPP